MYLIYITFPGRSEALKIAHTLIDEKFLACANISSEITSVYFWEGKICEDLEVVLFGKTREEKVDGLMIRVKELHPYVCPSVVAIKADKVDADFHKWVDGMTVIRHDG